MYIVGQLLRSQQLLHLGDFTDQIIEMIDANPIVLIQGETGSTQVAQYILEDHVTTGVLLERLVNMKNMNQFTHNVVCLYQAFEVGRYVEAYVSVLQAG